MALYDALSPYIASDAPGVDAITMERSARDSVIEFCRKSLRWQQILDPMSTSAGVPEYTLEPPEHTTVAMVMKAWYDGRPIAHVLGEEVSHAVLVAEFGDPLSAGTPSCVAFKGNDTILLDPAPSANKSVVLLAALAPTRASTEFPDFLFEEYAEELAKGAASRLLKIKSLPIYDLTQSALHYAEFLRGVNNARLKANRGGIGRRESRFQLRKEGK